jgi:hypothetical protein
MYFLVVVALIGGAPQSLAGAFSTESACLAKRAEILPIVTSDPAVAFYSVECVKGYEPKKAM